MERAKKFHENGNTNLENTKSFIDAYMHASNDLRTAFRFTVIKFGGTFGTSYKNCIAACIVIIIKSASQSVLIKIF